MINNRQAGRRRGRGGQQQRSQGGNPGRGQDNGNRIDNRARGNAAQLLEKYKALARDAQMQGDRVNTEYYLQFADHYFRVLAETRARFEETNPSSQGQGRRLGGANTFDEDEQDYEDEGEPIRGEQSQPPRQQPNGNQNGNGHAQNGSNGGQRNGNGQSDDDRPERQPRQERFADDRRPQRDGNRQDGRQDGRRDAREDAPRAGQQPDLVEQAAEHASADQPEVVVAAVTPAPETPAAEAPAAEPRRRGRPRRTAPVEAEPAPIFDAGLLPPSLTASAAPAEAAPVQDAAPVADADAEPAEKPRRRRGRPPATEPVQA
ncbi:DUF4167 domain-containing protein [Sphingomonas sp. H39-1-10]|uniref:DUF4167 domain-containing protein n=1 Tax=Sphingomonas pollutisoli TaxID=3030829 RepID=UPI0023B92BDD|nr:DUF4167 domain-containing protein [Sphingomonas pollutisoli]MDF0490619.1 DUF4167 domain-containing protein [Sphingomonas pollutisoli]